MLVGHLVGWHGHTDCLRYAQDREYEDLEVGAWFTQAALPFNGATKP